MTLELGDVLKMLGDEGSRRITGDMCRKRRRDTADALSSVSVHKTQMEWVSELKEIEDRALEEIDEELPKYCENMARMLVQNKLMERMKDGGEQ